MKRWWVVLMLGALVGTGASAQVTANERAARSEQILGKIAQLEAYNLLLPLLLTPEQIKQLLPAIERARRTIRNTEREELELMKRLEPKLDAALEEAKKTGKVPTQQLLSEANATFRFMTLKRQAVLQDITAQVRKALDDVLTPAQRRLAVNTIDPRRLAPGSDPEKLTDDMRLDLFVQTVLLQPVVYEVLVEMSKKKPDSAGEDTDLRSRN